MRAGYRKKSNFALSVILPSFILGMVLIISVFLVCTELEKRDGNLSAENVLEFLKSQCVSYDDITSSRDTRNQIQLLDKASELKRCLAEGENADSDFLQSYAENQRISGIILIDGECNITAQVSADGTKLDNFNEILNDGNVTDVIKYPKKMYMSHMDMDDGNVYDIAAISTDNGSAVFCYSLRDYNAADERQISIENLLMGYNNMEMDGIIIITDGQTVLSANDETIIGKSTSDYPLTSESTGKISSEELSSVSSGGTDYLARTGKCRGYSLYVFFPKSSVYSKRMSVMAYVLIVYTIFLLILSILKQREASHTSRIKMEFLHQMSHDIRTPINGIRGMVRIGDRFPNDTEKQTECRTKIWEASGLLLDLVNDVLDMGKLESGEMLIDEKPFNIHELMENVTAVMENQAATQGISLTLGEINCEHASLIGSAIYVRRILVNIISNAIKYNQEGGTVYLSCRETQYKQESNCCTYEFVCVDTGVGMSRDFQKKMFEKFTQEKTVGEVAHHGTGLGLSIVKSLVREMKGTVRCESEVGKGTIFYVTLPFTVDKNPPERKPEIKSEVRSISGMTVLLVEDNEINMEIAEFILEEDGAKVIKAWNGEEAVKIFQNSDYGEIDIILMDVMMPIMDGETAAREIRMLERKDAAEVPIIAMTANAFEEDVQTALESGMNAHLAKPVDPEQIKRTIIKYAKNN